VTREEKVPELSKKNGRVFVREKGEGTRDT
jgi:hypothetical protein